MQITHLEKLTLLEALILAIGHSGNLETKKQYMELAKKVRIN